MKGTVLRRAFVLATLGGIFYLSHQPSLDIVPPLFPHQDKVLHAVEFFILGLSLLMNMDIGRGRLGLGTMFSIGAAWAVLDEVHQSFVPGRDCSVGDLVADLVGLCLCFLFLSGSRLPGDALRKAAEAPGDEPPGNGRTA